MRVLISGASIAGPVLAYWLVRHGFDVTVVERAEQLRKAGGHAVDLFRPAMDISERMGVADRIQRQATGTDRMVAYRAGWETPTTVDLGKVYAAISDRHVEVMRDELSAIYNAAARNANPPNDTHNGSAHDGARSHAARHDATPGDAASDDAASAGAAPGDAAHGDVAGDGVARDDAAHGDVAGDGVARDDAAHGGAARSGAAPGDAARDGAAPGDAARDGAICGAAIRHGAARGDVEYIFGDSITAITETPDGCDVTFERGAPRRFDLVVGADGLHSNVRRIVFGPEEDYSHFIGAYLAVLTLPADQARPGTFTGHFHPGRVVGVYGDRHGGDARAVFLFTSPRLDYHHRDTDRQKTLLRSAFRDVHPTVDTWLSQMDDGPFYFDSITQLRMDTWSRGRVTLVGDAGYCPGPAVGGSTSLAVLGAYTLAGELAAAGGDHLRAFPAYERSMAAAVEGSRAFAIGAAKGLIPSSKAGVWALITGSRLAAALPPRAAKALARLNSTGVRLHDSFPVKDFGVPASA